MSLPLVKDYVKTVETSLDTDKLAPVEESSLRKFSNIRPKMDYLIPKNYDLRVKFGSTTIDPSPQRGWERRRPNAMKGTKNEDTEWILLLRRIRKNSRSL